MVSSLWPRHRCHCDRRRHLRRRQRRLCRRCRHRSLSPLSSPLSSSPVSVVVVAAQQWRRSDGQRRWWCSDGDGGAATAMGRRRPRQWQWHSPPPALRRLRAPRAPVTLFGTSTLLSPPAPPSSVATAATAVFLLSPHLPHCLIVVSIIPRREGAMRPLLSCRRECVSL